eukprot:1159051-Pelagomonas_calceolata.AAC.5
MGTPGTRADLAIRREEHECGHVALALDEARAPGHSRLCCLWPKKRKRSIFLQPEAKGKTAIDCLQPVAKEKEAIVCLQPVAKGKTAIKCLGWPLRAE